MIYINKADALAAGLTHEGTLFGVPAWFVDVPHSSDEAIGTPKFVPLIAYCIVANLAFAAAAYLLPVGTVLRTPIYIKGRITHGN